MLLVPCRLDLVRGLHHHVLPTLTPRVLHTLQGMLVRAVDSYCRGTYIQYFNWPF